ncbi:MAG: hypothetical protein ACE5D7_06845 [Fidelibacterota bacterium]
MNLIKSGLLLTGMITLSLVSINCTNNHTELLSNLIQLTFKGDNGEAYLSNDGKRLIFQSKRDGFECDKIYTMNLDGSDQKMVSADRGAHTCSYFSKDDDFIIFSSTMHEDTDCPEVFTPKDPHQYVWPLRNFEIYKANPDGSNIQQLTHNEGYDAEATVHPFLEKIIFSSLRDGDMNLFEMDYNGENIKQITFDYGYDGAAFYSPDGNQIVWRAWYPKNDEERAQWAENVKENYIVAVPLEIFVADADGKNKVQLTHNGATNWAPSWHPDGKRIVFSSNMDDWNDEYHTFGHNFEIYLINVDGTGLTRVTYNDTFDSFPMFTQDGRKLVFASNRDADNPRATHIYIADFSD